MSNATLTAKQQQLYDAIQAGAAITYRGHQELRVEYGVRDARNYIARMQTLIALRDRRLIRLNRNGITLLSPEPN